MKPEKRTVTLEDMNLEAKYQGISYDLVVDGKIMYDNLKVLEKDYNWLKSQIKKFGFEPEEALVATIDASGQIFCQRKMNKKKKEKK